MHGKHQNQQQQMAAAPKGCVTVRVGVEGEEQRRFAVPLGHLKHPLFGALLEEAEREYGFRHQGAIAIPCRVDRFVQVENLIGQDLHGTCARQLVDLDGTGGGGALATPPPPPPPAPPAPPALRRLLPRLMTYDHRRSVRPSRWLL